MHYHIARGRTWTQVYPLHSLAYNHYASLTSKAIGNFSRVWHMCVARCVCMFACVYVENMILRSNQYSIYSYLMINIDLSYQENSL